MSLTVCTNCSEHHYTTDSACPHCGTPCTRGIPVTTRKSSMAFLLGLALAGCGDKEEDTAADTSEPITQPAYGVVETGDPEEE